MKLKFIILRLRLYLEYPSPFALSRCFIGERDSDVCVVNGPLKKKVFKKS